VQSFCARPALSAEHFKGVVADGRGRHTQHLGPERKAVDIGEQERLRVALVLSVLEGISEGTLKTTRVRSCSGRMVPSPRGSGRKSTIFIVRGPV
jgi:hypothetical protein